MGFLQFHIPGQLSPADKEALQTGFAGGLPDYLPWPSTIQIAGTSLTLNKEYADTGCLYVPWPVGTETAAADWPFPEGIRLLVNTTNLGEREGYYLPVELARGKVNQIRNQAAEWQGMGLKPKDEVLKALREMNLVFARNASQRDANIQDPSRANATITSAVHTADTLVKSYISQVLDNRFQNDPKIPLLLSCRLTEPLPNKAMEEQFLKSFNTVQVPFSWKNIEPVANEYNWEATDKLFAWVKEKNLAVIGGPFFDFNAPDFPDWLQKYLGDSQSLANIMLDFVEAALERYKETVDTWQLMDGCNVNTHLKLDEEDLIWLNCHMLDTVWTIHPQGNFGIALYQPTGEDFAKSGKVYSPFTFVEALLRNRIKLTSLGMTFHFGYQNYGSKLRDFLELSRILDLYSLVGFPVLLNIAMPSQIGNDATATGPMQVDETTLTQQWSEEYQAKWLDRLLQLSIGKMFVAGVNWPNWSDTLPHALPHVGLLDQQDQPKKLLSTYATFREKYLH